MYKVDNQTFCIPYKRNLNISKIEVFFVTVLCGLQYLVLQYDFFLTKCKDKEGILY